MPDLSLLEPLAKALGVSVAELLSGEYRTNANRAGNLLRSQWYVCPVCGNVVYALGQGSFHCCGVALPPAGSGGGGRGARHHLGAGGG